MKIQHYAENSELLLEFAYVTIILRFDEHFSFMKIYHYDENS